MQDLNIIGIVEAASDLSQTTEEAMRRIAKAATSVIPCGPIAVAELDGDAPPGSNRVWFERAEDSYVARFIEWQRAAPAVIHRLALSFGPRAVQFRDELRKQLSPALQALAHQVVSLCILADTGDGSGLHIVFGNPELSEWRPTRLTSFHEAAVHLAVAWRLRKALNAAARDSAFVVERGRNASATDADIEPATPTARDALRRAVVAHGRARAVRDPVGDQELWPALLAGRWSLLDSFTAARTRYIVAQENPPGCETLRALSSRERSVLELALTGRSGKWIAFEMQLSASVVTRNLHTALRKIGVADTATLSGVRNAPFEPLDGLSVGVGLAVARLAPMGLVRESLSDAERAIVDSLLGGKRIAAIARERGTSPRTVAHQITSTYHKLGVSSRRELLALFT